MLPFVPDLNKAGPLEDEAMLKQMPGGWFFHQRAYPQGYIDPRKGNTPCFVGWKQ